MPTNPMAGGATAVRGTSTDPTFQSYTDGLSPGSQIARSVTAEIADTDPAPANKDGVLKVLHIELKPQNLGSVSVRMSLKDDVISLHMETSRHETTAAIEKERSALASALKSAGYVVDEITTQTADPTRASGRIEARDERRFDVVLCSRRKPGPVSDAAGLELRPRPERATRRGPRCKLNFV